MNRLSVPCDVISARSLNHVILEIKKPKQSSSRQLLANFFPFFRGFRPSESPTGHGRNRDSLRGDYLLLIGKFFNIVIVDLPFH